MAMAAIILIVLMAIQDFTGKVSPRPYKAGILQQLGGSNVHPPAFLKVAHARMPWRGPSTHLSDLCCGNGNRDDNLHHTGWRG
jgi:hypothetical protein